MIVIVQHSDTVRPGHLIRALDKRQYELFPIYNQNSPHSILERARAYGEKLEGAIILGGGMSVNDTDKYHWIEAECEFIRLMVSQNKPMLGICLGAQMIAKALGQKVQKHTTPEIGWWEITATEQGKADPIFGTDLPLGVFQYHYDTFDLPEMAVLLASSAACPRQAYRIGKNIYGLQYHPEVDESLIEDWSVDAEKVKDTALRPFVQIPDEWRENMQQFIDQQNKHLERICDLIF